MRADTRKAEASVSQKLNPRLNHWSLTPHAPSGAGVHRASSFCSTPASSATRNGGGTSTLANAAAAASAAADDDDDDEDDDDEEDVDDAADG